MKKILIFFVALSILTLSFIDIPVNAEWNVEVIQNGNMINVSGVGDEVNIFLLNPGKTVSDLNNAATLEDFEETVNYCNIAYADAQGKFHNTITVKEPKASAQYTLYLKSGSNEYTKKLFARRLRLHVYM